MTMTTKKKLNRLGKCDVCKMADALYTCPRCDTVTCSLACVKRHKTELDCDGVRVKTKYVPANRLDENVLLSDYRLLEEIKRRAEYVEWGRQALENIEMIEVDSPSSESSMSSEPGTSEPTTNTVGESIVRNNESGTGKKRKRRHHKKPSKTDLLLARTNRRCKQYNLKKPEPELLDLQSKPLLESCIEENSDSPSTSACISPGSPNLSIISSSQEAHNENADASTNLDKPEMAVSDKQEFVPSAAGKEVSLYILINSQSSTVLDVQTVKEQAAQTHPRKKEGLKKTVKRVERSKEQTMFIVKKAAFRAGIQVVMLPKTFEKHWENTSYFSPQDRCILWHLKVSFISSNFYTLSLDGCAETMRLAEVVKGCLRKSSQYWKKQNGKDPLEGYNSVDFSTISVLMSAERIPNSARKFYVLDMTKTLRENFVGKCIVEFPQLCVAIEDFHVVSRVQHSLASKNFFQNCEEDSDNEAKASSHRKIHTSNDDRKGRKVKRPRNEEAERESGELTDSSDGSVGSESEDSSGEELFQESEFRSIYKDLLTTFQTDVDGSKRAKV